MRNALPLFLFALLLGATPAWAQPSNDNCANAEVVSIGSNGYALDTFTSTHVDVTNATTQNGENFHGTLITTGLDKKSVWYQFSLKTARGILVQLQQDSNDIAQDGAGFAVYKANNCLPPTDSIQPAKLTPINKFGNSFNPCLAPGNYLIQVGTNALAEGELWVDVTTSDPGILNNYDKPGEAAEITNSLSGTEQVSYDLGCQTIESDAETCSGLSNPADYTQSTWHVFRTDNYSDIIRLELRAEDFPQDTMPLGYRVYEEDVRSVGMGGLTAKDVCKELKLPNDEGDYPFRGETFTCDTGFFAPNSWFTVQVFWPKDYVGRGTVRLEEIGGQLTDAPHPSLLPGSGNKLGELNASSSGQWNNGLDYFACNAWIEDNSCGSVQDTVVDYNGNTYELATWYTFTISNTRNLIFNTHNDVLKRIYSGDVESDCNLTLDRQFIGGYKEFKCFAPGTYSVQMLGPVDTVNFFSGGSEMGRDADLSIYAQTVLDSSDFGLNDANRLDSLNVLSGTWQDLPGGVKIFSDVDQFACSKGPMPSANCGGNRALYRVFKIGDANFDGTDDRGILTIGGGKWGMSYRLYRGHPLDYNTGFSSSDQVNFPEAMIGCVGLFANTRKICVTPGTYTLVTMGEKDDIGRSDQPWVRFDIVESTYFDPNNPFNAGDITATLANGNQYNFANDVFDCDQNPLTIDGKTSCDGAKQLYRQFFLDSAMSLKIESNDRYRVFQGKISDGASGLSADLPIHGDLGCSKEFSTGFCENWPTGWYTIVSYGGGGSYSSPYNGGDIAQTNWVKIKPIATPKDPQYNRPSLAYEAGAVSWSNTGTSAYPETETSYDFAKEYFNCQNDVPFSAHPIDSCSGYNRTAYYTFDLQQVSYLRLDNIRNTMRVKLFPLDARDPAEADQLDDVSPITHCMQEREGTFSGWKNPSIDFCNLQPDVYTLVVFADERHIGGSVRPKITISPVENSRFDFASNAYEFGDLPGDSTYHYNNVSLDDENPIDTNRAASNDFISCRTGAFASDPGDGGVYCFAGNYLSDYYPMDPNTSVYEPEGTTIDPVKRNLWYTFTVTGPGKVFVKVDNKTPGKTTQVPFSVWKADDLGTGASADSTQADGLSLVAKNRRENFWGCVQGSNEADFSISPCDPITTERYFVVVENHINLDPNHQVEVGVRFDSVEFIPAAYDHYSEAYEFNGGAPIDSGLVTGGEGHLACATRDTNDPDGCSDRTLWYKFSTSSSGKFRTNFQVNPDSFITYNTKNVHLLRELTPGDSSEGSGWEEIPLNSVSTNGQQWGESCISPGTYYLILTGCNYTIESLTPRIWIDKKRGDLCTHPKRIKLSSLGSESSTATVDCHTIGEGYGEDGSNMGCLFGPEDFKSTWFRVNVALDDTVDLSFKLSESTTALPSEIRYRVTYGDCFGMSPGPCNSDGSTEFTLNCMEGDSLYYVQVVTPESATGTITMEATISETPLNSCEPIEPTVPKAVFFTDRACKDEPICFDNFSTAGDSIEYDWDFGDPTATGDTSDKKLPCYTYSDTGVYPVQLIATNIFHGTADTANVDLRVFDKATGAITKFQNSNEKFDTLIGQTSTDFFANPSDTISDPPSTYFWDFDNGQTSTDTNPTGIVYGFEDFGQNIISLTITNGTCDTTINDTIMVGFEPIFVGGPGDGTQREDFRGCGPLPNMFAGGPEDGHAREDFRGCGPLPNTFAGGPQDGHARADFRECGPLPVVFAGGPQDGHGRGDFRDCGALSVVFRGGPQDGHARADFNDCAVPPGNVFVGGPFDGSNFGTQGIDYSDPSTSSVRDTICPGEDITLTPNLESGLTANSYQWSNGATSSTITVSPAATKEYSVMIETAECGGDTVHATFQVFVPDTTPQDNIQRSLCPGATDTLHATLPSPYTLNSGASTPVLWSNGSTDDSIVVTPTGDTTLSVAIEALGPNGCEITYTRVYELQQSAPAKIDTFLTTTICNGDTATISVATPSGVVIHPDSSDPILWSTSETTNSIDVHPTSDATYTATVDVERDGVCTEELTVTHQVNVSPLPTVQAGSNQTLCNGDSAQLGAPINNDLAYSWSPSTGLSATDVAEPMVFVTDTTDYILTVTDTTQSPSCSASDTVTVFPDPGSFVSAGADINKCPADTATLSASGGASYSWFDESGTKLNGIKASTALQFKPDNGRVEIDESGWGSSDPFRSSNTDFTITVRFRADNFDNNSTNHNVRNVLFANASNSSNDNFELGVHQDLVDVYFDLSSGNETENISTPLNTGEWYTLTVARSGSNGVFVYLDGVEIFSDASNTNEFDNAGPRFAIGRSMNSGSPFEGVIDELRIWDYQRTQTEIVNDLTKDLNGTEAGLFAYYPMEDGTGSSTLTDETGNGFDGTLTDMDPNNDWVDVAPTAPDTASGGSTVGVTSPGTYWVSATSTGGCSDSDTVVVTNSSLPSHYRTQSDGDWTDLSVWEVSSDSSTWVDATSVSACGGVPFPHSKNSLSIDVRDSVYYDSSVVQGIDETTVTSSGTIFVPASENLRMVDSSDQNALPDIRNQGRINVAGTFERIGPASTVKLQNSFSSEFAYTNGNQDIFNTDYGILQVSGGGDKSVIGTNTHVANRIDFQGAHILMNNGQIRLDTAATTTGGSPSNGYFITNAFGSVVKEGLDNNPFTYPVGHSDASYNPMTVTNNGTVDDYDLRVTGSYQFDQPNDDFSPGGTLERTWHLDESTDGGSDLALEVQWKAAHEGASFNRSRSQYGISETPSDGWTRIGASGPASGSNPYTYATSGVTSAGSFTIGGCDVAPLLYRSISSGDWTNTDNWEVFDNIENQWIKASVASNSCGSVSFPTRGDSTIWVRHDIDYDSTLSAGIDELIVMNDSGYYGYLRVPKGEEIRIADGPTTTDLENQGTLEITGQIKALTGGTLDNKDGSWVHYSGDVQDVWEGSYANLEVSSYSGSLDTARKKVMGNSTSLRDTLQFSQGLLVLQGDFTLQDSATIQNADSTNGYFVANQSGFCIWHYQAGTGQSHFFPLGGEYYAPAKLTFDQVTSAGTIRARNRELKHPKRFTETIERFWTFEKGSIGFSGEYQLSLTYNIQDLPALPVDEQEEQEMVKVAGAYNPAYTTPSSWRISPDHIGHGLDVATNTGTVFNDAFSDFTFMLEEDQVPLPVEMLPLAAAWEGPHAKLTWQTASESGNRGFQVQRSKDGFSFEQVGFVPGAGFSQHALNYSFRDRNAAQLPQQTYYYRLKQVDFNGQYRYSNVVQLQRKAPDEEGFVSVFPVPAQSFDELDVRYQVKEAKQVKIQVYDMVGQQLYGEQTRLEAGLRRLKLPLQTEASGTYLIRISDEDAVHTHKVVIQR